MEKQNSKPEDAARLRQKAEKQLKLQKSKTNKNVSEADKLKLIHELEVYQIELEMQNEELVIAKQRIEELAKEKYKELYDFAPSGYFNLTPDGDISELNLAGAKMLGKERRKLVNSRLSLFISRNTRAVFDDLLSKVLMGKSPASCEVTFLNGSDAPIYAHLSGTIADDGKHCLINALDITERKRAEGELINLSEMQSIILRIASEYINMPQELVDKSINNSLKELGEFVLADRAYVFEYDWIKNVCNNTYEWCSEGIKPEIDNLQNVPNEAIDYWVEAHKNGKEMNIEDVMQLPPDDGVRQIFEPQGVKSLLALPMMNLDKCIGFIGFDSVRKIHKYSEREKTLLKIFSEMLVNIGNRKELEKNLIKAKEKAEESDRLKSAFLANMSHEIRTPMNSILGFTDFLLEPDLSSEQKESFIKIVYQSGQRMLNTVTNIVEISKIEAGMVNVSEKETDLNEGVEELICFFKPEAEKKGLKLILEMLLPAEKKNLSTDQNKLDSILTNLIKNAIKYTESGTIKVGCQIKGAVVEFYIKDTGVGIPKHRQEAIFERFMQADITDTRAFEGSGLGLAISKSYVEMLGGNIWVKSREGKGSTFYFTLPVKNNIEEKSTEQTEVTSDNKKKKPNLKKLKILIVEDDVTSRNYISLIVNDFSAELLAAGTGTDAIELCRNTKDLDLILMDIKMPGLDGYEATRRIREFNKDVVIIAQTAYGLTGDRKKSIESGCNDYIAKPINKNELQAMMQMYFGK